MRVAIIGCGEFSRSHIKALAQIKDLSVVAVCDQDRSRADEKAKLSIGTQAYSDLATLLENEQPDAVHILTPPETHASLAIQAMQAGSHALVEKPIALNVQDVDHMVAIAHENGVCLGTNHNYLFAPCIMEANQLISKGEIGEVIYVDSYYGISGSSYTNISGLSHWAWRLPGGVFTNFLPHLIYLQQAFLPGEVSVVGVTLAQDTTGSRPPTELAVLLKGGQGAMGIMVISMRAKPYTRFVNIYGTKGNIHADLSTQVCTLHKSQRLPNIISKVLLNLEESVQLAIGTLWNTALVAFGQLPRDPGLHRHLHEFYSHLQNGKAPPVSGEDGRAMIEVMEHVWSALPIKSTFGVSAPTTQKSSKSTLEVAEPKRKILRTTLTEAERLFSENKPSGKVLVTGATGLLGHYLIAALQRCGVEVVALVRDKNRVSFHVEQHASVIEGDLRNTNSLEVAMSNIEVIFHCAAATNNNLPWKVHYDVNVMGTEALFEQALKANVKRVIHVSSVIGYGLDRPQNGRVINEQSPYAKRTDKSAHYMRSKIEADKLAFRYWRETGLPITILRLGILYGPGAGRMIGRGLVQLGALRLIVGGGRDLLPFTYVENAVDSLLLAAISANAIGQAYNVVDEPQISIRDVIKKTTRITGEKSIVVPIPLFLMSSVARIFEWKFTRGGSEVPPKISPYVVRSACRNLQYDTTKAREELGWYPAVSLEEGLHRVTARS